MHKFGFLVRECQRDDLLCAGGYKGGSDLLDGASGRDDVVKKQDVPIPYQRRMRERECPGEIFTALPSRKRGLRHRFFIFAKIIRVELKRKGSECEKLRSQKLCLIESPLLEAMRRKRDRNKERVFEPPQHFKLEELFDEILKEGTCEKTRYPFVAAIFEGPDRLLYERVAVVKERVGLSKGDRMAVYSHFFR